MTDQHNNAPAVPDETIAAMWSLYADTNTVMRLERSQFAHLVRIAAKLIAATQAPAPAVPDGLQWFTVAEHGIPEVGAEVIGGLWYTDPWLKPEFATTFMWGQCRVVESKHRDFKDGKQWHTFGPSHNQITHWARINNPGQAATPPLAQARGLGLTDDGIADAEKWRALKASNPQVGCSWFGVPFVGFDMGSPANKAWADALSNGLDIDAAIIAALRAKGGKHV